ncbi:BZ3500_MvSof-1268-A1-R1_Chr6-3g08959 [Microbotryum saponariae]|uniref:BZ3500_MvSof-1268-A1-R1_Chr6-3g08959 protein n=2 Tax=Microbotryum saponariae TaxID=289078 RepID=A0A2X0LKB1_9BASI|nr:BZ3500_MvSof-1268-A1-R1_Chr6-3g08959 [Microbotryum saponariae]SDA07561.1 BZ3501_MvSof-1269-A2-R1_Chr6-2g08663 [Microbotryum saponariae]
MGRPSRLKPRFPRIKPSDYLDHPDCPNQYATMPLCLVTFGGTIVDKGGRKRPRKAKTDMDATPTTSATSNVETSTNQRVPVASTSVFANDLNFSHDDFNEDYLRDFPLAQQAEYEDLGGMDLSMERWDPPDPDLQRPTHQELAQEVLPTPRVSDPPVAAKQEGYFKFITLEHEQREGQRAALLGLCLDLRISTNGQFLPLVSNSDKDDLNVPSPCHCQHVYAREVVLYDGLTVYSKQVTFCASNPPCIAEAVRLAQLGFIASTAVNPGSAFSFRMIRLENSRWRNAPYALTGHAAGFEDYFGDNGWSKPEHYHGHPYVSICYRFFAMGSTWTHLLPDCGAQDKELRKQWQRAIDEFRAIEASERDRASGRNNRPHHTLQLDYMIALDGNFQQTRENNATYDVQGIVPSLFLSDKAVLDMKALVENTARPTKKACTESWKAADGGAGRVSSRKIDTGLVAGVCRHDIALKMVNLEKTGEKLYFALAIVKHISDHLPPDARIGILYDIACNFKHHIEKRHLLPELFERLEFATSVFHAYAHTWGCQVDYNPRLIPNFGFTDGEGCERLWSALRSLIPINRPSNKSHRLVNLAVRTQAVNDANVSRLGSWFTRRLRSAKARSTAARKELDAVIAHDATWSEEALRVAWQDQRRAQASKTATQEAEEDRLRESELYKLAEELYRIDCIIDESEPEALVGLNSKHDRLAREIDQAAIVQLQRSGTSISSTELRHLCQCSVALRKLHREVIAYKTSRENLLSTRRGRGGSTLGQREANKARKTEVKTHSGAEKARKAYNKAVNAFRTAGGSSPSHLLNNLPSVGSLASILDLEDTDFFWQDGFFTHVEAAWATDPWVKRGIVAVRDLDRAAEEFARIGAEVRQTLAWLEDEHDLISSRQALWLSATGQLSVERYSTSLDADTFLITQIDSAPTIYDHDRVERAFGSTVYATIRDRALVILEARMRALQKRERDWFRDSTFLLLWYTTRGPADTHEPVPRALKRLTPHLLLNPGNVSKTTTATGAGARSVAPREDASGAYAAPSESFRTTDDDRLLARRITEQLDADMNVEGAKALHEMLEQQEGMLYDSDSSDDLVPDEERSLSDSDSEE